MNAHFHDEVESAVEPEEFQPNQERESERVGKRSKRNALLQSMKVEHLLPPPGLPPPVPLVSKQVRSLKIL